jgi:hypothetical protein
MPRRATWPEELDAAIRDAEGRRFRWGQWDCFLFAAYVVRHIGGPDIAAGIRGTYSDEAGAAEAIAAWGQDLEDALTARCAALDMQEIPPALARRGDLVVLRLPGGPTAGICGGAIAWCAGPAGVVAVPMVAASKAWAV